MRRALPPTGIDPRTRRIIVGKFGYLFADFRKYAARSIMTFSPGFTTLRVRDLPYGKISRPIFPLDPEMSWHADGTAATRSLGVR